jgi:adsorption protein B
MGLKQKFVPIHFRHGRAIATREYFPRRAQPAIRQRTRWVTGIMLQSWEMHSAPDTVKHLYWFWRDRRGLIGNLATPLSNILFLIGLDTWANAKLTHHPWGLAEDLAGFYWISIGGLTLQAAHTAMRMGLSARLYGWRFAAAVPLRILVANAINACSTSAALWNYTWAKVRREPLRWAKTEHAFPSRDALIQDRKRVGEILTGGSWIAPEVLESALASQPPGRRIGEHLVALGLISEHDLYSALALQNRLPLGVPDDETVSPVVARTLPAAVARKWRVLPFRVAAGALHVAGSELPVEEMQSEIRRFSSLDIRFYLITPTQFDNLAQQYLF